MRTPTSGSGDADGSTPDVMPGQPPVTNDGRRSGWAWGWGLGWGLAICLVAGLALVLAFRDPPPPGSLESVRTPDLSVDGLHPAVLERMTSFLVERSDAALAALLDLHDAPVAELRVFDSAFRDASETERKDLVGIRAERQQIVLVTLYQLDQLFPIGTDTAPDPKRLEQAPRLLRFLNAFVQANAQASDATAPAPEWIGLSAQRTIRKVEDYLARHQPPTPAPPKEAGSAGP